MMCAEAPGPRTIGSSAHIARERLTRLLEQSKQDMIWDAKAVKRTSNCHLGSQIDEKLSRLTSTLAEKAKPREEGQACEECGPGQ